MRAGYETDVHFFEDEETPTRVHWYLVPGDRPCLPVPSFVQDAYWSNENGLRPILYVGNPPGLQGEVWSERPYVNRGPRPGEAFTGHYCGSESQWSGSLSIENPADVGHYGCCQEGLPVVYVVTGKHLEVNWHPSIQVSAKLTTGKKVSAEHNPIPRLSKGTKQTAIVHVYAYYHYLLTKGKVITATVRTRTEWAAVVSTGQMVRAGTGVTAFYGGVARTGQKISVGTTAHVAIACKLTKGTLQTATAKPTRPSYFKLTKGTLATATAKQIWPVIAQLTKGTLQTGGIHLSMVTYGCGDVVAAGSTQGTATSLPNDNNRVTSTGANQGVILPAGCYRIYVRNNNSIGGNSIKVYPPTGGTISGGATNAADTLGAQLTKMYCSDDGGTTWKASQFT